MSERVLRGVSLVYAKYYLLLQVYPSASWIEKLNPVHKAAMQTSIEKSIYQKYDEIKAFRIWLDGLTAEELTVLYEVRRRMAQFYNHPSATANTKIYTHYAKLATWTLDEAIAITLGKNPKLVNWELIDKAERYPFVEQYLDLKELADRATNINQLSDPVIPSLFLAWVRRMEIEIPQELFDLVEKHGSKVADWQDAYNHLKGQCDVLLEDRNKLVEGVKLFGEQRNSLSAKVAELEARGRWPWGDYETKALRHLVDAAEHWWKPCDPNGDDHEPTNDQVINWLVERGVPKGVSQSIAIILHKDGLPTGPRTGKKK